MAERPIIFSGPMVRAILEGRKTQTRRILKGANHAPGMCLDSVGGGVASGSASTGGLFWKAPLRFAIADRLWVREAFATACELDENHNPASDLRTYYRADGEPFTRWLDPESDEWRDGIKWRPSIHMPRWASRITLVVMDIRVQRLQDITEDDAKAEGCDPVTHDDGAVDCGTRKTTFANLWESIHGSGSWNDNPWVVAITFEKAA